MNFDLSPSRIALAAFPELRAKLRDVAEGGESCAFCGIEIPSGYPIQRGLTFSSKFTDWNRLADPASDVACVNCVSLGSAKAMALFKQCVITADGKAYSLTKDSHRQWFLTDPPEPPFVCIMAEKLMAIAHLVWHAPVTLDRNLIYVQRGHKTLTIDRPYLMRLVEICAKAADMAREAGIKVTARHPFSGLSRNLDSMNHGVMRSDIAALLNQSLEGKEMLHEIMQAGEGELWALATLSKSGELQPEKELIQLKQ